jgi:taurine transport system substrate-binding protein
VFDVTSVPAAFAAESGDTLAKFLKVTADANAAWAADPSDEKMAIIAQESGMDVESARSAISTFSFPTIEDQLSEAWLGGTAAPFMKGVADVFVEAGSIDSALDSYEALVNTAPLEAAGSM